jgi:AcrR family transcriptional regulator
MSPTGEGSVESAKRRGRGRSRKLDAEIARAALDILVKCGTSGFSIERVAREVGCSKSSIYRRHRTKQDLILEATIYLLTPGNPPIGAHGMLAWLIESRVGQLRQPAYLVAAAMLMDEAARGTELGRRYVAEVFNPLRQSRIDIARRGIASGELRPDADLDLLLDAISGTLLFRTGHLSELDESLPSRLAVLLADGVGIK